MHKTKALKNMKELGKRVKPIADIPHTSFIIGGKGAKKMRRLKPAATENLKNGAFIIWREDEMLFI